MPRRVFLLGLEIEVSRDQEEKGRSTNPASCKPSSGVEDMGNLTDKCLAGMNLTW